MKNCIQFLQWALPKLNLKWRGYKKVHKQVCKRLRKRMSELKLKDYNEYMSFLESNPNEWGNLDAYCRISISRFFRDRKVFETLGNEIFPILLEKANKGNKQIDIWSIGCASGEEPYSISLILQNNFKSIYPNLKVNIHATDADQNLLNRAQKACYSFSSIKEVPSKWLKNSFENKDEQYCLKDIFKSNITWNCQDIRLEMPERKFDLILCRNLIWYYFEENLQSKIFEKIVKNLKPQAFLIIGIHELLPENIESLQAYNEKLKIYRKKKL